MKYRWQIAPAQPLLADKLAAELRLSPLLVQCLVNRGFSEPAAISRFLEPRLKNLADPFLLPNMAVAVERLFRARELGEPVVIFGDYDGIRSKTGGSKLLTVPTAAARTGDLSAYGVNIFDPATSAASAERLVKRLGTAGMTPLPHSMDEPDLADRLRDELRRP